MAVSANARGGNKQGRGEGQKMTPEIYFARKLAANDKKTRDRTLKKLKKWLGARSTVPDAFSEEELMKLWRGLFYCMWMSDKPLIQEDLAESISSLLHSVSCRSTALRFAKVALKTMAREWPGIDNWRMEKFMMFIRRLVRHCLMYLASSNWDLKEVEAFSSMLSDDIINANKSTAEIKVPIGFQLHIINIFAEELAKVGKEELPSPVILQILKPFVKCLATTNDGRLKKEITQHVFIHLIKQSDAVLDSEDEEEEEAEEASGEAEEEEEEVEESKGPAESSKGKAEAGKSTEDEDEETADLLNDDEQGDDDMEIDFDAKDPRAGGVNVVLPQLRPDFSKLADMVFSEASEKTVRTKNRKPMYQLVKKFRDVANGVNPLKVRLPDEGSGLTPDFMKKAARNLIKQEVKDALEQDTERRSYKSATKTKSTGSKRRKLEDSALGEDDDDISDDDSDMLDDEEDDEDVDDEDVDEEEDALDDEDVDEEDDEEAEDEDLDEEDSDDLDDDLDDEETVDDEEEQTRHKQQQAKKRPADEKKVVASKVATKRKDQPQGETCSTSASSGQFEVNDDWDAESTEESSPAHMAQLKKKLKARKKMQPWTETPTEGEIEIVIPNKKYQGSVQMKPAPQTKENTQQDCTPANGSRRVNFILDKNTAQEPKDYQESVRKSPGIPHDPHRQPPSGGVLKRCTPANQKQSQPMKRRRDPSARLFTRN